MYLYNFSKTKKVTLSTIKSLSHEKMKKFHIYIYIYIYIYKKRASLQFFFSKKKKKIVSNLSDTYMIALYDLINNVR